MGEADGRTTVTILVQLTSSSTAARTSGRDGGLLQDAMDLLDQVAVPLR